MKSPAVIAAELRQALRSIEMTSILMDVVKSGSVTAEQLQRYLEDALAGALDQTFLDFAERVGGLASIRQLSAAERAVLFREMAEGSIGNVQDVADRYRPEWTDERLRRELKSAILMSAKEQGAVDAYDEEIRTGDPKQKRRKLRDRRFRAKERPSAAKRRLMVARYRDRLIAHRTAMIARDQARSAEAAIEFARWIEMADVGDPEAVGARKFWDTRGDGKVRDWHVEIEQDYPDGLPLNEPFVTRWGNMRYPHDSQGHPKNRHGCRCKPRIEKARS